MQPETPADQDRLTSSGDSNTPLEDASPRASSRARPRAVFAAPTEPSRAPPSCSAAFQPGDDPALDLTRLASSCAETNGLEPVTTVYIGEAQTARGAHEELSFRARAGRCYRVFAVGEPDVTDLDLAILDETGRIAAADLSSDRFPIAPPRGFLCAHKAQDFSIQIGVMRGSGRYLMQVWGSPAPSSPAR